MCYINIPFYIKFPFIVKIISIFLERLLDFEAWLWGLAYLDTRALVRLGYYARWEGLAQSQYSNSFQRSSLRWRSELCPGHLSSTTLALVNPVFVDLTCQAVTGLSSLVSVKVNL